MRFSVTSSNYQLFADDATYFILNEHSIQRLATLFAKFEEYSSLKVNADKTEVCGIRSKKGVIQALSGFKAVNLVTDSILILGCHHSYKKELVIEKNFNAIIENMQTVLGLWSSRRLTVGGKILVFKTLCFSKMQYIAQMSLVPKQIIEQLKLIYKKFLWKNDISKIKHSTLIADYSDEDSKMLI